MLRGECLSYKHTNTASGLDAPLGLVAKELGLNNDGLLGQLALAEDLEVPVVGHVNDGDVSGGERPGEGLLAVRLLDKSPEVVHIDDGAVVLVPVEMVVAHADLAEVSRMVLVEVDAVVVKTSSVTATSGMLSVLSDTTVSSGDVSALLTVMVVTSRLKQRKKSRKKK